MDLRRSACIAGIVVVAALASPALAQVTYGELPEDFVLFVNFDEGSGETLVDYSSYGHDLELSSGSADWVADNGSGKALEFDGETAFTIEKTDALASFVDTITVGAWVRPSALDGWRNIAEMDGDANQSWKVGFNNANPVFTTYHVKDHTASGTMELDVWQHIAYVYDGANANFYIDGAHDSEIAGNGIFDTSGDTVVSLDVGWRSTSQTSFMSGAMDQLWISTDAKSAAEVKELMGGITLGVDPAGKTATTWGLIKQR